VLSVVERLVSERPLRTTAAAPAALTVGWSAVAAAEGGVVLVTKRRADTISRLAAALALALRASSGRGIFCATRQEGELVASLAHSKGEGVCAGHPDRVRKEAGACPSYGQRRGASPWRHLLQCGGIAACGGVWMDRGPSLVLSLGAAAAAADRSLGG
jgi:hypothetical protein